MLIAAGIRMAKTELQSLKASSILWNIGTCRAQIDANCSAEKDIALSALKQFNDYALEQSSGEWVDRPAWEKARSIASMTFEKTDRKIPYNYDRRWIYRIGNAQFILNAVPELAANSDVVKG